MSAGRAVCPPLGGAAAHLCCCALALCDVHGMCRVVHRQAQAPMGLDVSRAARLHDVVFSGGGGRCVCQHWGQAVACANTGGAQARAPSAAWCCHLCIGPVPPHITAYVHCRPDTANRATSQGTSQQPVGLGAQARFLARRCAAYDAASQLGVQV